MLSGQVIASGIIRVSTNRLISGTPVTDRTGRVRCRRRLGGLLNFYERAASL
jgi:hypothetical protein